jgi:nucleoside-diphosphate-sugar epimerase
LLNSNNINLQVVDARDYHLYSKIYSSLNPDVVIHLAAVSHANKSNKDPHSTFDHSLRTLENTLDVCRTNKTHVIYLSSSMVYGNFTSGIVNEKTPCSPIGIYGTLKYSGELIVKAYNEVFDLPYTIIRPSALYGERCVSRRVGQIFIENLVNKVLILLLMETDQKS